MKYLNPIYLSILFIFLLSSCKSDDVITNESDNLNAQEAYQTLDVSYGSDVNQKMDIYLPANRNLDTKIMILVHGGGWSSGDKSSMNPYKDLLLQNFSNLAVVNINYRLANETNSAYPMQLNDITSVINHLKDKRDYYAISDEIGFTGVSAGGHLSLLWSYAFDSNNKINMVCSIVGPTNFTDPVYLDNPNFDTYMNQFNVNPTTSYLEEISPYHNVESSSPPTILFYGGQDPLIPTSQGVALNDKLEALGVIHQFTLYDDEGHGWGGLNAFDTWAKMKIFIENHLAN